MKLAHVAYYRRSDGHPGGVPLFGHYLAQALGAIEYAWADYPDHFRVSEPEAAHILGGWLEAGGAFADMDAVIVDGFWGRGIGRESPPVISVAHNTWRSIARALNSSHAEKLAEVQEREYRRWPTVAVSESVAHDLRSLYGVEAAAVIPNAVDLDEFSPAEERVLAKRPVVVYASQSFPKGGDVVSELIVGKRAPLEFQRIGGPIGAEAANIREGHIFLAPSRTEGNSYAILQALACGLPVVASAVGLFADACVEGSPYATLQGRQVGLVLPANAIGTSAEQVALWHEAIMTALSERERLGKEARAWAEENASLDLWGERWLRQLRKICE